MHRAPYAAARKVVRVCDPGLLPVRFRQRSALLDGPARPTVELDIAMKLAAWCGTYHAGPNDALLIDGVLFQRQCMAAITHNGRLEARDGVRMAGHPVQRRG